MVNSLEKQVEELQRRLQEETERRRNLEEECARLLDNALSYILGYSFIF